MKNFNTLSNIQVLRIQLKKLQIEHRELDEQVSRTTTKILDPLLLSRLKKEKLLLKDKIAKIQDKITPDIIA
jgi:hypothetical protein